MKRLGIAALLFGTLSACATLTANKTEYEAYRRVRVAKSVEQRLSESDSYLRGHPQGRYQAEVRRWFNDAEPDYFAEARASRAGLIRYLNHLPQGPHAERATERLAELALADAHERRRETELTEQGAALVEKLSDADRMRAGVISEFQSWIAALATLPKWRVRTHELPHEFIYRYRMLEPKARCSAERCLKSVSLPYAIPDAGRLRARRALFDVVLRLEQGVVSSAVLRGPELFNRVAEAAKLHAVRPDAALARAEAIASVTTLTSATLASSHPESACSKSAVAPVVLARECNGLRIEVHASDDPEHDDQIVFTPIP